MVIVHILTIYLVLHPVKSAITPKVDENDDKFISYQQGILGMYYHTFNDMNFEYHFIRSKMGHYPNNPQWVMHFDKFESEHKYWHNHLARNIAYFNAPVSGEYTFHLVCKTRCQLRITIHGCRTLVGWSHPHVVTSNAKLDQYKDPLSAVKHTLQGKYRYCIEVLQKSGASANNWIGVGVTYPDGTEEIPMTNVYHIPDMSVHMTLSRFYKDSSETIADLLLKPNFPNKPDRSENPHPGTTKTKHLAKHWNTDLWMYRTFWYHQKHKKNFKVTNCRGSNCTVYVNGVTKDKNGFEIDFGNGRWVYFEIFQKTEKGHHDEFALRQYWYENTTYKDTHLQGGDSVRVVYPDWENRRPPTGNGISSTSLTAHAHDIHKPNSPALGNPVTYNVNLLGGLIGGTNETIEDNRDPVFTGLMKWTKYTLTTDFVGTDYIIRSDPGEVWTLEDVPTSAPLSLNVFALSSTEINSTWGDTIENNGEITGYDLEYAEVEFDGTTITPPWTLVSTIGPERTLSVSGLKFWKHYAFRVAAKTIDPGVGPFSSHVITRTLEDRPTGGAQGVGGYNTSETSLVVEWQHLLLEDRNGIITGYEISHKLTGTTNWESNVVTGKDTLSYKITGLNWFADYDVAVAGITAPGTGVRSIPEVVRTDEWKPQVPPPNVQGTDISSTELEITFDNIVDTFQIYGNAVQSKIRYTRTDDPTDNGIQYGGINSAIVIGLNEYTDYYIEVAIMTRRGGETFSTPVVVKTGEAPPSAPPDNIEARRQSSTSILFSCGMIPYEERNGVVTRYNFTIREKYVGTWETHFVDENDGTKELLLTGLEKYRYYEYIVSGCTVIGCGVEGEMGEERTKQDLPENVPDNINVKAVSSTQLNITWDEVPEESRRGIITGYQIDFYDTTIEPKEWTTVELPVEIEFLELSELKYFTNYSVIIKAKTKVGYGNFSREYWMATLEDVPEAHPYNFTCNNATSRSIKCTWDPVPEIHGFANGIVRGYHIYYSVFDCAKAELADCNETKIFVDIVYAPLLEHTIEGLDNFTEYKIKIDLYNGISPGPNTTEMVIYTDEDIPSSPPAKVEGFTASPTSVMAFWDGVPWGEKHGIIIGYIVYYRRMNEGPPSDYLRELMKERDSKRKKRSADNNANYEVLYNHQQSTRDIDVGDYEQHGRSRRSTTLYDGIYIYPEETQIVYNKSSIGTTITDLDKYQWYTLRVAALTSKGAGPTFDFNVSCQQEVPVAAPEITVFDQFSFGEIRINWTEITYNQSRGTVFDYNIIYYPVNVRGIDLSPYEQEVTSIWLEYPASGLIIRNLRPYVRYAFKSAALTFAGVGVYSRPFYAETCRCEKYFYTAYRNLPPYFWIDPSTGKSEGILEGLIEEATDKCCGSCVNSHGRTIVNWNLDKVGNDSLKTNLKDMNLAVLDGAEFVVPIEATNLQLTYNTQPYLPTVNSPGVAIFSRKIEYINPTNDMILYASTIIWTFVILFTLAVIGLGMFMWLLQCNPLSVNRTNQEDFPDDFIHGAGAGVWWAVSSMMRLGYGDLVASGKLGRLFSMPIILLGLVMCSVLISGFCSMYLSYIFTKSQGDIFTKKVVTLADTYDAKVVQRLGGKVTEKATTVQGLLDALRSGRVDRMAVDSLYGSHQSEQMKSDDVVFRGLKASGSAQGIVLGGSATLLEACFRQYLVDSTALIAERRKAVVDQDQKEYTDDEYSSKRLALARYESDVWMMTIQVCGGIFLAAFLIGIIYECRHSKKNKIHANILVHTRCEKFYDTESMDLIDEFKKKIEGRLEKIEVKHAFQRIDLIKNLRKRVEWLTPDQVNKYKF